VNSEEEEVGGGDPYLLEEVEATRQLALIGYPVGDNLTLGTSEVVVGDLK